jgi:alpha-1,3-glucosyltransferase
VPISSGDRSGTSTSHTWLLDRPATLYIVISIPLIAYCSLIHGVLFGKNDKYEYLPLMLTSSYSALGVLASWAGFCWLYFTT